MLSQERFLFRQFMMETRKLGVALGFLPDGAPLLSHHLVLRLRFGQFMKETRKLGVALGTLPDGAPVLLHRLVLILLARLTVFWRDRRTSNPRARLTDLSSDSHLSNPRARLTILWRDRRMSNPRARLARRTQQMLAARLSFTPLSSTCAFTTMVSCPDYTVEHRITD